MESRYASQALADGLRLGCAAGRAAAWPTGSIGHAPLESRVTCSVSLAGFANPESGVTSLAGFASSGSGVTALDRLTEPQQRALVLADNKLALNAGWDEEILRAELARLQ